MVNQSQQKSRKIRKDWIQPSGEYLTEVFWYAGGIPRGEMELREVLDLNVMTVSGKTLRENLEQLEKEGFFRRREGYLANYKIETEDVIRKVKNSKGYGSIAVLKGNMAPEGAVVKYSAVAPDMLTHEGSARGGPIALVEDGDLILIDIPKRSLPIVGCGGERLDERGVQAILAERQNRWKLPLLHYPPGILKRYATQVASAMEGAYLMEKEPEK